jgi:hypothetical protein
MGMFKGTAVRTGKSTAEASPGWSSGEGADVGGTVQDGIQVNPAAEDEG